MNPLARGLYVSACFWGSMMDLRAVMFLETGDPAHHTTTPGDNSGWQYEGKFMTFLGVPIAPHFFITAKHFGGTVGTTFDFRGEIYTTIAKHDSASTDLTIWEVDHSKPFPNYAPLSSGTADVGATATIMGRGTRRGAEYSLSGVPRGWLWGPSDDVQRWGRNIVDVVIDGGPTYGELLYMNFDNPGIEHECHLSVGDSGGGVFVLEDGLWRLAGINFSVDGPFREVVGGPSFMAALYDARGLYLDGQTEPVPDPGGNNPSGFYASRISASLPWITGLAPAASSLAPENFEAWRVLYFTPAQIAAGDAGPLADPDADGITNLVEFAQNLDPTYSERHVLPASSGIRGLPVVGKETTGGQEYLTIEFIRRTAGSGSGLTCLARFSQDLNVWAAGSPEQVTAINPRWERVKVRDTVPVTLSDRRFARVHVVKTD